MVAFFSPLLPLAKLLRVPLLDFDAYAESRDSGPTGEAFIPPVVAFFRANYASAAAAAAATAAGGVPLLRLEQ